MSEAREPAGIRRLDAGSRYLGVPLLFSVAYAAVGFSLYFALGLVADRGLGLTPLIFLGVGIGFLLNTLTYVEGEGMVPERGGSATFARAAFRNELVSFVAGWAILIDYVIVIALAAISVPHYLTPISAEFGEPAGEIAVGGLVIALVGFLGVVGFTGIRRQRMLTAIALAGVLLLFTVVIVGLITAWDPGALTAQLDLFTAPSLEDLIYAGVIATVAFAGIEAAANLAPDLQPGAIELRKLVLAAATLVPVIYVGIAVVGLMAVPVLPGPDGPQTALGGLYVEDPVLGIVQNFEPTWLADVMQVAVVAIAPAALIFAASTAMLGLSRHVYVLATNRQIPSWLGKLNRRFRTPHVAILIAAVISFALVVPTDVVMLAGLFAFGATIAFTIAHLSIIRLRLREPDRERPFRIPFAVPFLGGRVPLPTLVAAVGTALAWLSVVVFHEGARWAGTAWMVFGLVGYVVYRRGFEGTQLSRRIEVPEEALVKDVPAIEYSRILVPVFGTRLDDDIVSTAGRLADAAESEAGGRPALVVVYVVEMPLTVPLDAPPPQAVLDAADATLARAYDVVSEYEVVEMSTVVARARTVGSGIVATARELQPEVIVMGGEPPSRIKGGAVLGGIGGERPDEIGPVTEYVLKRAPCRVLITAAARRPPPTEPARRSPPRPRGGPGADCLTRRCAACSS